MCDLLVLFHGGKGLGGGLNKGDFRKIIPPFGRFKPRRAAVVNEAARGSILVFHVNAIVECFCDSNQFAINRITRCPSADDFKYVANFCL